MNYLIQFDENGRRGKTYVLEEQTEEAVQAMLDDSFELVPEEDYQLLIGNVDGKEYIRQFDLEGNPYYAEYETEATLDSLKAIKYAEVKEDYLKALYAVAWVDQGGNLYGYDTDPGSQLDFSMSHARAKLNGTTRYNVYTDKSNLDTKEFLEHTPEMFDKVLVEVGDLQEEIFKKYYAVKELVKAAKTPEELAGISFDMEVPVDGQ